MRYLIAGIVLVFASHDVAADQPGGFTRADGKPVEPYVRSNPNVGGPSAPIPGNNTNPYAGNSGTSTASPDASSPYYQGPDLRHSNAQATRAPATYANKKPAPATKKKRRKPKPPSANP